MQRFLVVGLFLLLAGVVSFFVFWGEDGAPPLAPGSDEPVLESSPIAEDASADKGQGRPLHSDEQRTEVAVAAPDLLDDPEIRAGLSGFRGRVVSHDMQPVADCGVRFYRGAMDSVLSDKADLFADAPTAVPDYIAGDTQTAEDGTFLISGVWPHGFYVMFAGIGTDAPMHEVVTRTPSPGEIIDLGDVVLPDAGVIVGTVVDAQGEPLAGALVRAADVPGTVAGFFPLERFDPEGALLVREDRSPISVIEMPGWVKQAFEHLPIPTTYSESDGSFRLVGVVPGSNMLATTAENHLSDVKPSVRVRAGEEKNVGTVRLREGEELWGKVVDAAGEPIAGAEVLAGSTIGLAPVDLARYVAKTDAQGNFTGLGFAPGKVTVAARRGPGHAWVLADPQPILDDIVVTLPATFGVDVTVTLGDGRPAATPSFRLLNGRSRDGAAEMAIFGFVPPVDLGDRLTAKEDVEGQWRITNLNEGRYTLVARAPGHAMSAASFEIDAEDASVSLQLEALVEFTVRVLDHESEPIRNAAIYAECTESVFDMPTACGRTADDGTLTIDQLRATELKVSAEHPKWGVVHGTATLGSELILHMQPPGSLEGILTENGLPPEAGQYTVIVEWRRNKGPRGPIEQVPRMVTPLADGKFRVTALQPGRYRVQAIDSLSALRSPGDLMQSVMFARLSRANRDNPTVDVVSGQVTQVQIDAGEKPIEGPTAHLFGSVIIDGRLAEGYGVRAWVGERNYSATVDRAGRFDMGIVPADHAWVTVYLPSEGIMGFRGSSLFSQQIELKESEEHELTVEIMTSSISGIVVDQSGNFVPRSYVTAHGKLKGRDDDTYLHTDVDAEGRFSFEQVPEGSWRVDFQNHRGEEGLRGTTGDFTLTAGAPVTGLRLQVAPTIVVKGRVDLSVFANKKPRWIWVSMHELGADGVSIDNQVGGAGIDMDDGTFSTDDLPVGTYAVRLHCQGNEHRGTYRCQNLTVPPQGLKDVLLIGSPE